MGTPCLLRVPLSLMAGVRVNFPLSGLDTVWERIIRRCCGKLELVLKQFLPHKLFCFLWFLGVNQVVEGSCVVAEIVFAPANLLPISFPLSHMLPSLRIPAWESPCCFSFPESHCQGVFHGKGKQVRTVAFVKLIFN